MGKKKVTVAEFLDALEADNIKLKRGGWFDSAGVTGSHDIQKVGAACILGVACVNLGVTDSSLGSALDKVVSGSASKIIRLNDTTTTVYPEMVKSARKLFKGKEQEVLELTTTTYLVKLLKTENA